MPAIDDHTFTVTTLLTKIKRISAAAAKCEAEPTARNKGVFKVMSGQLDDMYSTFHRTVALIASHNTRNNIEQDLEEEYITPFESEFFLSKAQAEILFPPLDASPRVSLNESSSSAQSDRATPQVQLPKIKLPELSGNIAEWQNFSEIFNVAVHKNASLSNVQRHMHLRSALKGEALALVQNLPLTEANYPVCWDTLARRYDNSHLLTAVYLDALFELPSITLNAGQIRSFSGKIIEATGALKALGYQVDQWAVPVVYMLRKKLPSKLRERWEAAVLLEPAPSIKRFLNFLDEQAHILEAAHPSQEASSSRKPVRGNTKQEPSKAVKSFNVSTSSASSCAKCSGDHELVGCGTFRRDRVPDRIQFVKSKKLCLACLSPEHFADKCARKTPCKHCKGNHHSLLHLNRTTPSQVHGPSSEPLTGPPPPQQSAPATSGSNVTTMQIFTASSKGEVIVATAMAQVLDQRGRYQDVRLLIDPGSEASFISRACLQRLALSPAPADVPVLGMGQTSLGICREKVECKFKPARTVEIHVSALVVDFITRTPSFLLPPLDPARLVGKELADPSYFRPSPVDILLGAEWFAYVMIGEPQQGPPGSPSLIESVWGHCLIGRHGPSAAKVQGFLIAEDDDLGPILQRSWEMEELPSLPIVSKGDQGCKCLHADPGSRQPDGRYVLALPLLPDAPRLGDSHQAALLRCLQPEKHLTWNSAPRHDYSKFMADYLEQGHMRRVERLPAGPHYYIPHHCIFRMDTSGSMEKFGVVFDSAMTTQNGPSLNQVPCKRNKLRDRWRCLQEELPWLNWFTLPRCIHLDKAARARLHGFPNALEAGFVGKVYLRCEVASGEATVSLLMAKSRVAPVKTCSLPRLELCGAWLVVRLLHRAKSLLKPHQFAESSVVWYDSTVALPWVKSPPHRWKAFVAYRVSLCQQLVPPQGYRQVPTAWNPADCASRGLLPSEIWDCPLWVGGPERLKGAPEHRPILPTITPDKDSLAESKARVALVAAVARLNPDILRCESSLTQQNVFAEAISRLQVKKTPTQNLPRLAPSLDRKGIIRVGGRLRQAQFSKARKHPIVVLRRHCFTVLIKMGRIRRAKICKAYTCLLVRCKMKVFCPTLPPTNRLNY